MIVPRRARIAVVRRFPMPAAVHSAVAALRPSVLLVGGVSLLPARHETCPLAVSVGGVWW